MVGIADGDTLTLLDSSHQQHQIGRDRRAEKGQPYGTRSKMNLSSRAFGMDARADCYKVDRYGRDCLRPCQ